MTSEDLRHSSGKISRHVMRRDLFFFFQAEDGIRDLTVTGVQTCALPIYLQPLYERAQKMSAGFDSFRIEHVYREQNREADALANEALDETEGKPPNRSEERRVGKEGRSRWSPYH